jgi:hypothetical protein
MRSYADRYIEGKEYSQDALIPMVILVLGSNGGRATKKYVEEKIYDLFREEFKKDLYHEKVANASVPRWKHDIAWARERAKQNHGYIKSAKEAGRGTWELTSKGKAYFDQLVAELKETLNEKT